MNTKVNKLLLIILVSCILAAGVFIRIKNRVDSSYFVAGNNLIAYYYDISNKLYTYGNLQKVDTQRLAPLHIAENAPPFLAFMTVYSYKIIRNILPSISFIDFAFYLPVIIYVIWALVGSVIVYSIFRAGWSMILFLVVISFVPVSIELTRYGRYTEEFIGAFLVFCFFGFYLIWFLKQKKIFWYVSLLFLIFIELTWQQFHLVLGIILAGSILLWERRVFYQTLKLVIFSLLGSQIVCWVLGSNYSPFAMLYEFYYGARYFSNKDLSIAMRRTDWRHLGLKEAILFFGYAGVIIGFFTASRLIRLAIYDKQYRMLCIGMIGSFLLMFFFVKSRYMFLPFFLLSVGVCFVPPLIQSRQLRWIKNNKERIITAVIAIFIIGIIVKKFEYIRNMPRPMVLFEPIATKIEKGRPAQVTMILKNTGGPQLREEKAFSGLHIEVKNASVSAIKSTSPGTPSGVTIKPNAHYTKDLYWFESWYRFLDADKSGRLQFTIIPQNNNVSITYRATIPGTCGILDRLWPMVTLRKGWSDWSNSWRSENCIIRLPASKSTDVNKIFCKVKVFAAHKNLQDFYCYEQKLTNEAMFKKNIQQSIVQGYEWIKNNINPKTQRLEYVYYPESDRYTNDNDETRQIGALWTITKTQSYLKRHDLDGLIQRSLDYYLSFLVTSQDAQSAYLKINNKVLINNNALMIITLLNAQYPQRDTIVRQLARGILNLQNKDGSYSGDMEGISSGEAMFSLMSLYSKTKDQAYLDSVRRAFYFYKTYWEQKKYFFIHWQTQALTLFYNETKNPEVLKFIFDMNDWMIDKYQIVKNNDPRQIGGIPQVNPSSSNTAAMLEGLSDAYALAKREQNIPHIKLYERAVRLALQFVLNLQVRGDNTFINASRATGGYMFSFFDQSEKISNAIHSLNALIKISQIQF